MSEENQNQIKSNEVHLEIEPDPPSSTNPPLPLRPNDHDVLRNLAGNDDDELFNYADEFTDEDVRSAFMKKVLTIVLVQLVTTFCFVYFALKNDEFQDYLLENELLFYLGFIGVSIVLIILVCCTSIARLVPCNYILLLLFTIFESIVVGYFCLIIGTEIALRASLWTIGIVSMLTFLALTINLDATEMLTCMCCCTIIFGIAIITVAFMSPSTVGDFYINVLLPLGVIIFCVWLVIDIQLLMGGNHQYALDPEDYIIGALRIYIDIINIFLYIARMFRE